jgi:hypothetical protein
MAGVSLADIADLLGQQGPSHDPDLRQGPTGALAGRRGQARATRASRGRPGRKADVT